MRGIDPRTSPKRALYHLGYIPIWKLSFRTVYKKQIRSFSQCGPYWTTLLIEKTPTESLGGLGWASLLCKRSTGPT